MSPLVFFFGRHTRVLASLHIPPTSLDSLSLKFVLSIHIRVQQALDKGKEGRFQLIRDMAPRSDQSVLFGVGEKVLLRADDCPISGNKTIQIPLDWAIHHCASDSLVGPRLLRWICKCCRRCFISISCDRFAPVQQAWASHFLHLLRR